MKSLEARITDLESTLHNLMESFDILMDAGVNDDQMRNILASSINGEVTEIADGRVIGWVQSIVRSGSPLPVTVFYGGKKICTALAVHPIEKGKVAQGARGRSFNILLPRKFFDGKSRIFQVKAGSVDVDLENKIGAVKFTEGFPIEGKITSNKGGLIEGWVVDKSDLSSPVLLSLKYGNDMITKVMADGKQPNLARKFGKNNDKHGFKIKLPDRFGDGKKRNFHLQISPWDYDVFDKPVECKFTK